MIEKAFKVCCDGEIHSGRSCKEFLLCDEEASESQALETAIRMGWKAGAAGTVYCYHHSDQASEAPS